MVLKEPLCSTWGSSAGRVDGGRFPRLESLYLRSRCDSSEEIGLLLLVYEENRAVRLQDPLNKSSSSSLSLERINNVFTPEGR